MNAFGPVKGGDQYLEGWDLVAVGWITLMVPPALGGVAYFALTFARGLDLAAEGTALGGALLAILAFLAAQVFAPFVALFLVPIALVLGRFALRIGWGGYGIAAGLPAVLAACVVYVYALSGTGYVRSADLQASYILAASAALHGGVACLSLRFWWPAAIGPRKLGAV